jgi:surface carbohydrate biosynthesis protein
MKTVYFHIDELARDAVVASALAKYLKASNINVFYGNRRISNFFKKFNVKFPFDLAVFPSVDLLQASFKNVEEINFPVVILPTESISGTENTIARQIQHLFGTAYAKQGVNDWAKKISKFCLWGQGHKINLINSGLGLDDCIEVVGHPRYDELCFPKLQDKKLGAKKRLGLISRFDLINIYDGRSNLEFAYESRKINGKLEYFQSKNRDIEDYYHNSVLDLRIFFNLLDKIDFSEWDVSIRVHPRENRKNWENLVSKYEIPIEIAQWNEPFSHWLINQDAVVAPPSTSFYDAAILGIHAVSIGQVAKSRVNHANEFMDDFDPIFKYFHAPKSVDELISEVNRIGSPESIDKGLKQLLLQELNYPNCLRSLKETAKIIKDLISSKKRQGRIAELIFLYIFREIDAAKKSISLILKNNNEQSANYSLGYKRRLYISSLSKDISESII